TIVGPYAEVVELGSGASVKTKILLSALDKPAAYIPVDISEAFMHEAVEPLRDLFPALTIRPVAADFTGPFALPDKDAAGWRLFFFPGSTIGNLHPKDAESFLARLRQDFAPNGMIIGIDLKKDPAVLRAAYNDSQGVTAAFNINILEHINRVLSGTLAPEHFRHEARYNTALGRIEMHLVSLIDHTAAVAGKQISFRASETIHTESSYKYDPGEFAALAARAGWRSRDIWVDSEQLFSVHLLICD
ncbi:MAG: L-histidine N(alpha)-methyltransferase, partial [Rhodospirillales bacterium]